MKKPRKTPDVIKAGELRPRNPLVRAIIARKPKAGAHRDQKKEEDRRKARKKVTHETEGEGKP